jgi:hypothetical protein
MPPRSKPARRVSPRLLSRKPAVSPRELEQLFERAEKYLLKSGKQLERTSQQGRKSRGTAA